MGVAHVDRSISDQRDSNSPTIVPVGFTVVVPYTTVCITHPPGPFFHDQHLHSWNSVDAKNVGVGNISPRALRRRIVRDWHPLGCRAIELGKPPRGRCDIHRPIR